MGVAKKLPTILVVDDESLLRHQLEIRLTKEGYNVLQASTGLHAKMKLSSGTKIDVIVSDYKMPGMNGLDLLSFVRQLGQGQIPFIMITGHMEKTTVERAVQGGVTDFLLKPFKFDDLRSRIEKYLQTSDESSDVAESETA